MNKQIFTVFDERFKNRVAVVCYMNNRLKDRMDFNNTDDAARFIRQKMGRGYCVRRDEARVVSPVSEYK